MSDEADRWPAVFDSPGSRLHKMHRRQVHRDAWPDFDGFDPAAYPAPLRRDAALQWAGRARAEYGSIHQFTQLGHALCEARAPAQLLGALSRLITDEVRHTELCGRTAEALLPGERAHHPGIFRWPVPRAPWRARDRNADEAGCLAWCAEAILIACCLGETLSRPMLDALIVVSTDPLPEAVARQIVRDEHLHATFGWESLGWLWPRLHDDAREHLQAALGRAMAGFTNTTACGIDVGAVAHRDIVIERGDAPNLGTLSDEQYAFIYYATLEQEIFPQLREVGLDPEAAWASTRPGRAADADPPADTASAAIS